MEPDVMLTFNVSVIFPACVFLFLNNFCHLSFSLLFFHSPCFYLYPLCESFFFFLSHAHHLLWIFPLCYSNCDSNIKSHGAHFLRKRATVVYIKGNSFSKAKLPWCRLGCFQQKMEFFCRCSDSAELHFRREQEEQPVVLKNCTPPNCIVTFFSNYGGQAYENLVASMWSASFCSLSFWSDSSSTSWVKQAAPLLSAWTKKRWTDAALPAPSVRLRVWWAIV